MEKTRLRTNVAWMLIGNGSYAFMQWIQLSMLAKLCSSYELGSYTLALAITAPVFLFFGLQLRQLLVTDVKNEYHFSDFYSLRILSLIISFILIAGYAVLNGLGFSILSFIAILKTIECIGELFNAQQQAREQMKFVALSLGLKGLGATLGLFIGIYYLQSLNWGLLLAVFSNIAVLYLNDYRNYRKLISEQRILTFNSKKIKSLIIKGLPLGVVMLLISLNANVPKYLIEYFKNTELQGIYSALSYCIVPGLFVTTALGQSFMPRLSKQYATGNLSGFRQLCGKYVSIIFLSGLVLFILSLFFGEPFLKLFFSDQIATYHELFSWVMLSGIIMYVTSSLGYILSSMRMFNIQPYINGLGLIVNIVCCYFLLDPFGLYGIVYASIASVIIQGVFTGCVIAAKRVTASKSNVQR